MIEYKVTNYNIHICNSYEVTDTDDMLYWIDTIRNKYPNCRVFRERSTKSLIREWKTHNRLYRLGLWRDHTKDVDLNHPQKWYAKVVYFILGSL